MGEGVAPSFPYSWGGYLLSFLSLGWRRRGSQFSGYLPIASILLAGTGFPYSWGGYLLSFPSLGWHRRGSNFSGSLPDAGSDQVLRFMPELLQMSISKHIPARF